MNKNKIFSIFIDCIFIIALITIGWFLIGFYSQGQYLSTGYQDWIYQVGKIQSLQNYGLTSWDHVWANGSNYWRLYQYLPHFLPLLISQISNLSVNQSLIYTTIGTFILTRILFYVVFRIYKIHPLIAFTATVITYTIPFEWKNMKDYSIFFANLWIPIFLLAWIGMAQKQTFKRQLITVSLAGFAWTIHPVLGITLTGLFFFTLFFRRNLISLKKLLVIFAVFLLSSAPFTLAYISHELFEYSFSNPVFARQEFAQIVLSGFSSDMGILLLLLFVVSWIGVVFLWRKRSTAGFVLLAFCSIFLGFCFLARQGSLAEIINQTQFVRGLGYVSLLLVAAYTLLADKLIPNKTSKLFLTVSAILVAGAIIYGSYLLGGKAAVPVNSLNNPLYEYFKDKDPQGSVYYDNVSETNFLLPKLRQPTSYFQHMLQNPLSLRFDSFLNESYIYTALTDRQLQLIDAYSRVLGVEYFIFPKYSKVANDLTGDELTKEEFVQKDIIKSGSAEFIAVQRQTPINYAYIVSGENTKLINQEPPDDPTMSASSYEKWDEIVQQISTLIKDGSIKPIPLNFVYPNILEVEIPADIEKDSYLFIAQSYDANWHTSPSLPISSSSLRMISVKLPDQFSGKLILSNNWPRWFLPMQFVGALTVTLTLAICLVITQHKKEKL